MKERYVFSQGIGGHESPATLFVRLGIVGSVAGASIVSAIPMTGTGIKSAAAVIGFLVAGLWSMI